MSSARPELHVLASSALVPPPAAVGEVDDDVLDRISGIALDLDARRAISAMRCGMRASADLLFKSLDGVAFSVGSIFFPHSSPLPLCEIMSACRQRAQFRLPMLQSGGDVEHCVANGSRRRAMA